MATQRKILYSRIPCDSHRLQRLVRHLTLDLNIFVSLYRPVNAGTGTSCRSSTPEEDGAVILLEPMFQWIVQVVTMNAEHWITYDGVLPMSLRSRENTIPFNANEYFYPSVSFTPSNNEATLPFSVAKR